jgi:hypothetical protein
MDLEFKCVRCEKPLTKRELVRYDREMAEWAHKHPKLYAEYDERDTALLGFASGVWMDCDRCAVKRLRLQKNTLESLTFLDRVSAGGPEGFWLVAVVILGLLLLCTGR